MKEVLFAVSELFTTGGIQRFNKNLLDAWSEIGVNLTVVTLNDLGAPQEILEKYPEFKIISCNKNKIKFVFKLLQLATFRKFDKIICGHINLSPVFFLIQKFTNNDNSAVLILHGIDVWDRVKGILRYSTKNFKKILAVSSYTLDSFFEQNRSVKKELGYVFPNTININMEIKYIEKKRSEKFTLLSVSRLEKTEKEKGIYDVLNALTLLNDVDYEYLIIGDGDDKDSIYEHAKKINVHKHVVMKGRVNDKELWDSYLKSDVFILPSKKEGFGIVFLEAMKYSLPVIAAAEKGALDVIEDNKTGLLVEYNNPKEIAEAIKKLVKNEELRKQLVENSKELIKTGGKFSFEAFTKRTEEHLC